MIEAMSDTQPAGRMTFFMPEEPHSPVATAPVAERADSASAAGTLRILVIDDSRSVAEITRLLLEDQGHSATVAHDGACGLETARRLHPHAVLCDINLAGGMDGYAVAQAFRQDPELSQALLIAATAYTREEVTDPAAQAGFDAVLTKPIDFQNLRPLFEQRLAQSN
jgi:CheY-like chemotaxis protein